MNRSLLATTEAVEADGDQYGSQAVTIRRGGLVAAPAGAPAPASIAATTPSEATLDDSGTDPHKGS